MDELFIIYICAISFILACAFIVYIGRNLIPTRKIALSLSGLLCIEFIILLAQPYFEDDNVKFWPQQYHNVIKTISDEDSSHVFLINPYQDFRMEGFLYPFMGYKMQHSVSSGYIGALDDWATNIKRDQKNSYIIGIERNGKTNFNTDIKQQLGTWAAENHYTEITSHPAAIMYKNASE